ncbi:MAG TPA: ATP-binding cassette domain-containing protein [Candidatus Solibacter sp.]|nr:ATP-binding cassette domain-containing protein [Candidatus Solibacter sp.]
MTPARERAAGLRTEELKKVYRSAPPMAAQTGFMFGQPRSRARTDKKKEVEVTALDGLTFEVHPGEILGLLGPNGAGKSTTVGILTTRIRPTAGRAIVGDYDVWREPVAAKRLFGVVPQRPNLDFALTAREILTFHGAYFGLHARESQKRAGELLDRFQLAERADQMVRGFSGGMMQRLSIARALVHDPVVLFLDEPTVGLDPQTRLVVWDLIREYNRRGKTILLTTHNMEEADALCNRIAIIDHGKMIACGSPAALKASVPGGWLIRLRFSRATPELAERLKALEGVRDVRPRGDGAMDVYADRGGALIPALVGAAAGADAEIHDVHLSEPSLENLFLLHTGKGLRE